MTGEPLTDEQTRALLAGRCPWCDTTWRSVVLHVVRKHGIGGRELREMAGLPWSRPLAAADVLDRAAELGRQRGLAAKMRGRPRDTKSVSPAGRQVRERTLAEHWRPAPRRIPVEDLPVIERRLAAGERLRDVAESYGVVPSTVLMFTRRHRPPAG